MTIHDAKNYKMAKIVTSDLENILKSLERIQEDMNYLSKYRAYKYVNKIINDFKDSKNILELQYKKFKTMRDKKGNL